MRAQRVAAVRLHSQRITAHHRRITLTLPSSPPALFQRHLQLQYHPSPLSLIPRCFFLWMPAGFQAPAACCACRLLLLALFNIDQEGSGPFRPRVDNCPQSVLRIVGNWVAQMLQVHPDLVRTPRHRPAPAASHGIDGLQQRVRA